MHHLLYDTYGDHLPLKLRGSIDSSILDRIPFFRLTEELLSIIRRDKGIKLTPLGALPKKTLFELYAHRFITDKAIDSGVTKLTRESDSEVLRTLHVTIKLAGLVRNSKGKLVLTKKSEKVLLADQRVELFKVALSTFTDKFNWSFNDGYPDHPIGQFGWGFTVYLLHKFGEDGQPIEFYANKYLQAFPQFLSYFPQREFGTPKIDFTRCYGLRTFERFLEWFGLISIQHAGRFPDKHKDMVMPSDLMNRIFQFD